MAISEVPEDELQKYILEQQEWVTANRIRGGSRVLVIAAASYRQCGWPLYWVNEYMDPTIGGEYEVIATDEDDPARFLGIRLDIGIHGLWYYPFFVLVPVDT